MFRKILCLAFINIAHVQPKPLGEIKPLRRLDNQHSKSLEFIAKEKRAQKPAEDYGDMDGVTELHVDYDAGAVYHKKPIGKKSDVSDSIVIHINNGGKNEKPIAKDIDKPVPKTTTQKPISKKGQWGIGGYLMNLYNKANKSVANTATTIGKGIKSMGKAMTKPFKSNH